MSLLQLLTKSSTGKFALRSVIVQPATELTGITLDNDTISTTASIGDVVGTLQAVGGQPPYSFSDPGGHPWAQVSGDQIVVIGTPIDGNTPITVECQDNAGQTVTVVFDLFGDAPPAFADTKSVQFNNTPKYFSILNAFNFHFNNGSNDLPFSISFWAKPEGDDTGGTRCVITKGATNNKEWEISYRTGELRLRLYTTNTRYIGREANIPLNNGQWYHVVFTYNGSETNGGIKIYIDNMEIGTANSSSGTYTGLNNSLDPVIIGGQIGDNNFLDGNMNEISFHDVELSTTQINNLFNSGKPADISQFATLYSQTFGWYRCGEAGDNAVAMIDQTGNGNNAVGFNVAESDYVNEVP